MPRGGDGGVEAVRSPDLTTWPYPPILTSEDNLRRIQALGGAETCNGSGRHPGQHAEGMAS